MNSVWYGDSRVDLVGGLGGRLTSQPASPVTFTPSKAPEIPPFLHGRRRELQDAAWAISERQPVEFHAPCGYGKSTLLRYLAAHAGSQLGGPGVYLVAGDDRPADVLQRLVNALFTADRPTKLAPGDCVRLLMQARAVVILDDVECATDHLEYLLRMLAGCGVVLASRQPRLDRYGRTYALGGLSDADAATLLRDDLDRPMSRLELEPAARLVSAVHGQPLRLRQAAALVGTNTQSFAQLAERTRREPAILDRLSIEGLSEVHRRVLATLALLGGAFLPADILGVVSAVGRITGALEDLRSRGVIERHDGRFGLPVCRAEPYRAEAFHYLDAGHAARAIAAWLGERDPSSEASLSAVEAALSLIGFAAERRDWYNVVRLVRVAEPILTLAGRWETCRRILDLGINGARAIGDSAAEALFAHQQGTIAQCLGELDTARRCLSQALDIRQRLGDRAGADLSRHNLDQLPGPPIPPIQQPSAEPPTPQMGRFSRRALAIASVVLTVLALGVTGVAALTRPEATPPSALGGSVGGTPGVRPNTGPAGTSPPRTGPARPPTTAGHARPPQNPRTRPATGTRSTATGSPTPQPPAVTPAQSSSLQADVSPGQPAATEVFTITNPNARPLGLTPAAATGDPAFTVTADGCPQQLPPHGQCKVTVTFAPTTIGTHAGELTVSDSDGHSASVALTGTGSATLTVAIISQYRTSLTNYTGVVRDNQGLINCQSTCRATITQDHTTITLSARATDFDRWEGACQGDTNPCTVNLTTDTTVTAMFQVIG